MKLRVRVQTSAGEVDFSTEFGEAMDTTSFANVIESVTNQVIAAYREIYTNGTYIYTNKSDNF